VILIFIYIININKLYLKILSQTINNIFAGDDDNQQVTCDFAHFNFAPMNV